MDAQQRMLLERSWEVLQAGCQLDASSAGATAVFVGIGTVEYTAMASHLGIGIYMATGRPWHPLHSGSGTTQAPKSRKHGCQKGIQK